MLVVVSGKARLRYWDSHRHRCRGQGLCRRPVGGGHDGRNSQTGPTVMRTRVRTSEGEHKEEDFCSPCASN